MVESADIKIFDRARLKFLRNRRAAQFHQHDFLHRWTAEQISDRLGDIKRDFSNILHIGAIPPPHSSSLRSNSLSPWGRGGGEGVEKTTNLYVMDHALNLLKNGKGMPVCADEEYLPFKNESLDLVTANLTLHSTNDLPGVLVQIRRALKPDGLFLAALLGGETLHELRACLLAAEMEMKNGASPRVFPFADKPQMGALMQRAGFTLPVVDSEIVTVTYNNMFNLMHDLRGMGETNIIAKRSKIPPGRAFFLKAAEHYAKNYCEKDGRIRATFEVIFLIGWSPHASQQQPLRPGSAKNRLADALGTREISTGNKVTP